MVRGLILQRRQDADKTSPSLEVDRFLKAVQFDQTSELAALMMLVVKK